jgi:hypothetical protein
MPMPDVTLARQHAERVLGQAAAVSRLVALALLAAGLAATPRQLDRPPEALAFAAAIAESATVIAAGLRGVLPRPSWALADTACLVTLLVLIDLPAVTGLPVGISPLYNFSTVAVVVCGLVDWPLAAALGCAGAIGLVNLGTAVEGSGSYPVWNAVPDSLALPVAAMAAWVIARVLRRSTDVLDAHRAAAADRSASMARERERTRYAVALGTHLVSVLEEVTESPGAMTPAALAQVDLELGWLRAVVAGAGSTEPGGTVGDDHPAQAALARGLQALVAQNAPLGLHVRLQLPDELRRALVPPDHAVALIGATREALTNVRKHAGTGAADIRVSIRSGIVEVEVEDSGRGYQVDRRSAGLGQRDSIRQRLAEVGGGASITSTPEEGTRVRLWTPLAARTDAGREERR